MQPVRRLFGGRVGLEVLGDEEIEVMFWAMLGSIQAWGIRREQSTYCS